MVLLIRLSVPEKRLSPESGKIEAEGLLRRTK